MKLKTLLPFTAIIGLLAVSAWATVNNLQGFEKNTGDWQASQGITRVKSKGGTLGLKAAKGHYYAELQNLHDGYQAGYGDGGYSFYGGADAVYHGAFYQSIDVYIDANWTPATLSYAPSFWIDMTPYHADPNNYGAEHNFHVKATGSHVDVTVDGETNHIASITKSGWYTFAMLYSKAPNPANPVITDMVILDAKRKLVANTRVEATSPGGPFASADLRGNGYVWITVWQNGFAGDVLGIDNVRTGLLPKNGNFGKFDGGGDHHDEDDDSDD